MKQHILVLSQYFYPEDFRINDICHELGKNDYEITVITGIPNYPSGTFYDGYGWFKKREEIIDGIRIIRLPIIARGKNAITMLINYLSFVVSGYFWNLFTKIKADRVFIFEVSPMTQALVGVWYAKKRKKPCYIYVQDLWPENVEAIAKIHNKIVLKSINKMVDYIYKNCKIILATSPSFKTRIEQRESAWKNNKSKVIYWPQYAEDFYKPETKKPQVDLVNIGAFNIGFTGNIGYAQGLNILPQTAEILKQKQVDCKFIIIGDGRYREELEHEIENRKVEDMFLILGRKAPKDIPFYLAWCNAAFISFAENPLFEMTIPAKLQSYMACGVPILAVADGETKRIIEEAECGQCVTDRNARKLELAIEYMIQNQDNQKKWGDNSLKYSKSYYKKDKLVEELKQIFDMEDVESV